ncbi:hypothetical protein Plhal304r1_c037g0112651 [Plasmopara halstedii]
MTHKIDSKWKIYSKQIRLDICKNESAFDVTTFSCGGLLVFTL